MRASRHARVLCAALAATIGSFLIPAVATAHSGEVAGASAVPHLTGKVYREVNGHCSHTVIVRGQGPSCELTDGMWRVQLKNGGTLVTHGPDMVTRSSTHVPRLDSPQASAMAVPAATDIVCANVSTDRYTRMIYAIPGGSPDRSATIIPLFRTEVYRASAFLNEQATSLSPDAGARLRIACDSSGEGDVAIEQLTTPVGSSSFETITSELQTRGYTDSKGRYLVFFDGSIAAGYGGQGSMWNDDSASVSNASNLGGLFAIEYSIYDNVPHWDTLLHETGHNMGAVQDSAPHASLAGHCWDGIDVMCYDDGGAGLAQHPYSTSVCATYDFDCNHDDFFHPNPPSGSYLATHWNTAQPYNLFIDHGPAATTPMDPEDPTLDHQVPTTVSSLWYTAPSPTTIKLGWTAATDNIGVAAYRLVEYVGGVTTTLQSSLALESTQSNLIPGSTHTFALITVDQNGNESLPLQIIAKTDTAPPGTPTGLRVTLRRKNSLTLAWKTAADAGGSTEVSYRVYRYISGSTWKLVAKPGKPIWTQTRLRRHTRYWFTVRSADTSGNLSSYSKVIMGVTRR